MTQDENGIIDILKHYCDSYRSILREENETKELTRNLQKTMNEIRGLKDILIFTLFYNVRVPDTSICGEEEIEIDITNAESGEEVATLIYGYKDNLLNSLDEDDEYWDEEHYLGDDCQGIFSYDGTTERKVKFSKETNEEKGFFYRVIQGEAFKKMIGENGEILSSEEIAEKIDILLEKVRKMERRLNKIKETKEIDNNIER